MKKSPWLKAFTLSSFLLFITAFVLYRSGELDAWFDKEEPSIQTSHNGVTIADNTMDTTKPVVTDTARRLMMPSSKSMILTDKAKRNKDTIGLKKRIDSIKRETILMSSSKSGIIFKPLSVKMDSVKTDTASVHKQKH
jgi:hypothetical protein